MSLHRTSLASILLLVTSSAFAAGPFTSMHPEEAYPDNAPMLTAPGPYSDFIKGVQQKLHEEGFDAGPVNGDFGTKTQAALAQFQLSRTLPASGMLDADTLSALGIRASEPETAQSSAGTEDRSLGGSCDALIGPEKEQCLQQGGTVEASMKPSSAAGGSASER